MIPGPWRYRSGQMYLSVGSTNGEATLGLTCVPGMSSYEKLSASSRSRRTFHCRSRRYAHSYLVILLVCPSYHTMVA